MGRGVSSGGGQSSLGYLFGGGEEPAPVKSVRRTYSQPATELRAAGLKTDLPAAEEKALVASPVAKSDNGTSLHMGEEKMGRSSNNYHRADGQNTGNFITVSRDSFEAPSNCCRFRWI